MAEQRRVTGSSLTSFDDAAPEAFSKIPGDLRRDVRGLAGATRVDDDLPRSRSAAGDDVVTTYEAQYVEQTEMPCGTVSIVRGGPMIEVRIVE
jgi:hypothetical protein